MKIRSILFLTGILSLTSSLMAYQWPLTPFNTQQPINSTLGEYRDTTVTNCPGPCPHFHDGVDIVGAQGTAVYAVLSGTIPARVGITSNLVWIKTASSNFLYIHISPDSILENKWANSPNGLFVTAGTLLGTINFSPPHLHFKETDLAGNVLNSLRTGALTPYSDTASPQVLSVQLLNANAPAGSSPIGPAIGANVSALDVRALAHDLQSLGSQNVGVYQIGYQVSDLDTGQTSSNFPEQTYLTIPSGLILSPGDAYDTTISEGGYNGTYQFYYFASDPVNAQTPLNISSLAEGHYQICVLAKDIKGNQNAIVNNPSACASMIIDRTPPGLTVFDASGLQIATGTYTKTPSISVEVDDALSGPGGVAVYDNGVFIASTPASFPPPSYTYTSTDLQVLGNIPEGNIQIIAYDQAGNSTATNFIVDHTPPVSVVLNPKDGSSMPATAIPGFVISGTAFDPSSGGVQSGIDHVNLYIQLPGGWWNGSATVGQRTAVTAQGTENWSYTMTSGVPPGGPFNVASEAVDKAGNVLVDPSPLWGEGEDEGTMLFTGRDRVRI